MPQNRRKGASNTVTSSIDVVCNTEKEDLFNKFTEATTRFKSLGPKEVTTDEVISFREVLKKYARSMYFGNSKQTQLPLDERVDWKRTDAEQSLLHKAILLMKCNTKSHSQYVTSFCTVCKTFKCSDCGFTKHNKCNSLQHNQITGDAFITIKYVNLQTDSPPV